MRKIIYQKGVSLLLAFALCIQLFLPAQVNASAVEDSTEVENVSTSIPATRETEGTPVVEDAGTVAEEPAGVSAENSGEESGVDVAGATATTEGSAEDSSVADGEEADTERSEGTSIKESARVIAEDDAGNTTDGAVGEQAELSVAERASLSSADVWQIIKDNGGVPDGYVFDTDISYGGYSSMTLLKSLLDSYHNSQEPISWSDDGNTLTSMPVDDGAQLILLSVANPKVYQNTQFKTGSVTGQISLSGSVGDSDIQLTFQGLGSEGYPFQGSFVNSSFTVKRTLFNALDYQTASFNGNTLTVDWVEGQNSTGALIASKVISGEGKKLAVTINSSKNYPFRDAAFGEISGDLDLNISFASTVAFENNRSNNNAGMVANTVSSGILTLKVASFPKSITIGIGGSDETKNNAGLLVGYLDNSSLTLNGAMELSAAVVQAANGGAGGIVGRVNNNFLSSIKLNGNIDLSNVTILGKYTGGVAGNVKDVAFEFGENGENAVILPVILGEKANGIVASGDVSSTYTGGIFGWYGLNNQNAYQTYDGTGFVYPSGDAAPITLHVNTSSGEAGALFGHLELGGERCFSVTGAEDAKLNIRCKITVADITVTAAGALVGKLRGSSAANELSVSYTETLIDDVTQNKIKYLGGLIGSVENAALSVEDISIMVSQPSATTYFGGLVGSLGENCVLKNQKNVKVSTTASITRGGGLVGEAKTGSVVQMSGVTNLSDTLYTSPTSTAVYVGQLVGTQDSALIFAKGNGSGGSWIYKRSTAMARVDDIGNYGQVIRLGGVLSSDLITIGNDNKVSFRLHGDYGTIASADDFALHAIAFSTNDIFNLYGGKDAAINTKNVTLTEDIDLTGTGIQGLTRDINFADNNYSYLVFAGNKNGNSGIVFDGKGHTLTINTGEIYGMRGTEVLTTATAVGSGQCYRHGCYGLLGTANSATVQNLTILGSMNIGADVATNAGFVFGRITGGNNTESKENIIQNVTLTEESNINIDGAPPANTYANVGGFIGYAEGEKTGITVKDSNMKGKISYTGTSDSVVLGGVMGKDYYQNIDLSFENITVDGMISSNVTSNAHLGGLIAEIIPKKSVNAEMSLKNVKVISEISNAAKKTSGGLLGYYWNNVDVTFYELGDTYAVTTGGAKLTANGAETGGLCFAATGRWNMQGKAVDMGTVSISNGIGALGLLVCHGERQGSVPGQYSNTDANALYLVMNTEWATAYKNENVTVSGTPSVFDEIVAYTASSNGSGYDITLSDAGVVSLHTTGEKINMTSGERNTYVNRTEYGKNKQTNPYSRYYYNLDRMSSTVSKGDVDTPEELLIWSVRKYCAENICDYLSDIVSDSGSITGMLDMDGYSYYPVKVANTDVKVHDATITFYNVKIETLENGNKSTLESTNGRTQHFAMHSSLLYDYYTDKDAVEEVTLKVDNLTLLGTVGMVGNSSGALLCGKIYGYNGTNLVRLELSTLKVDSGDKHLSVANFNANYAPLLINQVGSFATMNIADVTATEASAGATSMIGRVGDSSDPNTQGINLSFSQMKLPDTNGRFTKATMLHSLYYINQNNSAVYNFTKEEDWNGTEHIHNVTYGMEIGGTVEYADSVSNPHQYYYAQSRDNVSHTGSKFVGEDRDSFVVYLPYVYQKYNSGSGYHELQVNSSLTDIVIGCGTYGDPYQLSKQEELLSIATFLSTGSASKNWTLNIPGADENGNSAFCSGDESGTTHTTYVYDGSQWGANDSSGKTLANDTVYTYLQNAYYMVTGNMEVNNFVGFGTRAKPFRGVIVGKTGGATITLKGTLPQGFIVCSYGSVVKNLTLKVEGTTTVSFTDIQNNSGYTSDSYYGGVMGCILGGDNIIEDVAATYPETDCVTLGDTKPHLIPVGGYVGVISGGGVIFRGENTLTNVPSSKVSDEYYFYANSYVGRVIQGFAVQEGDGKKLDNSEKNYRICWLDSRKTGEQSSISVVPETYTIILRDAQALLVFSSITNSGGAGSGELLPYYSKAIACWEGTTFGDTYVAGGKVRNAAYDSVGNVTESSNTDYQTSLKDDYTAVSGTNASYLDTHYSGGTLYNVCNKTQAYNIELVADVIYDMIGYGNGYRSISPRYLANAVCNDATNTGVEINYKLLNPLISSIDGNGARIQTNIAVKEYVDDDHHAIAVGGVFNTIRFTKNATMKNITVGGNDDSSKCMISHGYFEWSGTKCEEVTHKNWGNSKQGFYNLNYEQGRGLIGIGGFAGNSASETNEKYTVSFEAINTQYLDIKGPFDAGGIIAHTGLQVNSASAENKNYHICYLVGKSTPTIVPVFSNCSYQSLNMTGGMMVGGYIGIATKEQSAPLQGKKRYEGEITITFDKTATSSLGADSRIVCQRAKTDYGIDLDKGIGGGVQKCLPASGGLIGCSSFAVKIDNDNRVKIENVEVRSTRSAGGIIAWPFSNVTIKNISIVGKAGTLNQIGDLPDWKNETDTVNEPATICEFAGGLIGYFEADSWALSVTDCKVENLRIVASLRNSYPCYAGGIVGNIYGSGNHVIANCEANNLTIANVKYANSSKVFYGGGLVGRMQSGYLYGGNLLVDSIQYKHSSGNVNTGNLLGTADSGRIVYLAGVSIQNTEAATVLQKDIGGTKPEKCYVAYADYTGAVQDDRSSGSVISGSEAPYVTTSPRGVEIPVGAVDSEGTREKLFLYSDGADPSIVKRIYDERNLTDGKKFYYTQAKDCGFEARYSSEYYSEMGLTEETANGIPNFPVLQVSVSDQITVTNEITNYLNLVTNNGYSTALKTSVGATTHVTCSVDLYCWNSEGKYFEKSSDNEKKAFKVPRNNIFETSFNLYDNGNNQFELLTVTFEEMSYSYKIQIPIVVHRMLEVDFTATLKDSPSFKTSDYEVYKADGFKSNLTVGYGTSVSALLTYTYNSAIGVAQDYDWQFQLDNGGFMGNPNQAIRFYNPNSKLKSLPEGTQLILLDCADNNKAYSYLVNTQSELEGTSIKLSEFKDSSGSAYSSRWISELTAVTAAPSVTGEWVLLENSTDATARVQSKNGYQYFRPKTKDDTDESKLYHLTASEDRPTEQFYLVIYIPLSSVENIPETNETEGKNLNGYISATLPGLTNNIACNINAVRVKSDNSVATDPHSTSESTYNFLSGYTQSLSDESQDKTEREEGDPEAYILLSEPKEDGNYLLKMDLVDEITVVKGQKDTADTYLFFKENISLPNYAKAENDSVSLITANGFPTGCYGNVEFYVYTNNESVKTYYKWSGNGWVETVAGEAALSYEWNSSGGNMELYLGTSNTKDDAVSLADIRQLAKFENEKFYVETKMDIHMSVPAAEQVIAGAITKGNAYTKLSYTTYLASSTEGFSSTNYIESKQGEVRYYQSRSGSSTFTHSANDPTQLGINCSDLASANGVIYTTGVYDLTTVSNAENLIQDANKVTYTLTLWQRQENGEYSQITNNVEKYIRSVRMDDKLVSYSGGYQWTDEKSGDHFASIDPENSKRFLLPVRIQVNTDVETNGVTFANYQLRLTATLYRDGEVLDQPINAEIQVGGKTEYVRYDYVTYTITRLLTSGYWGK